MANKGKTSYKLHYKLVILGTILTLIQISYSHSIEINRTNLVLNSDNAIETTTLFTITTTTNIVNTTLLDRVTKSVDLSEKVTNFTINTIISNVSVSPSVTVNVAGMPSDLGLNVKNSVDLSELKTERSTSDVETSTNTSSNQAQSHTTCANYTQLDATQQPVITPNAKLKKCCSKGMNYRKVNGTNICDVENVPFEVPIIEAIFYQDCIEDTERTIELEYEYGFPCPGSETFIYSENYNDILYVIQNGSLLRVDEDNEFFDVFDDYCLDMDRETKVITAMVCNQTMGPMVHVSKAQSYIYAICMLTSVPCLIVTAFFYLAIPQLRDLHGKSLACHSLCLAMGFLILSVAQIKGTVTQSVGFIIQYFILACFFWLAVMCLDICIQVWYYLPKKKNITAMQNLFRFIFYGIICQGLPLMLVLLSASKELPGMPSYYLKGITEATRSSQQYFIPPISTTLFVCFLLLVISFFGFHELDPIVSKQFIYMKSIERQNMKINLDGIDIHHYESTKQVAKSTAYLYTIMTLNWIFEIISFYVHTAEASLVLFDIMNALQGIVIFIIFVCLPQPLHIIKRWWMDRGSLELDTVNMTELENLNNGTSNRAV